MKNEKPQVFSKHLADRKVLKQLSIFEEILLKMMTSIENKPEALSDVLVLEVSYANFAGIITASILAELGAEVIKVEPPEGDPARKITYNSVYFGDVGIPFLVESRNKHYITLDLKSEEEREKFKKLVSKASVIIDATKPGFMDSLGVGYRQLKEINSGLIYAAISPYGHYTSKAKEFSNIPDTDLTAQAASGFPALIGDPKLPEPYNYPIRAGIWAAWYMTSVLAVTGILLALIHKAKTGEGQMIDLASNDAISVCHGYPIAMAYIFEKARPRIGIYDYIAFPYAYLPCKDGNVAVVCIRDEDFRGLLKILGRWDLEDDWKSILDRITDDISRLEMLGLELKKEFSKYACDELVKKALSYCIKSARKKIGGGFPIIVKTMSPSEVLKEKHWKIRNALLEIEHPIHGKFIIPNFPAKMSETPPRIKWIKYGLGEDNEQIRKKYNLD